MRWGALVAEWAPMITATIVGILAGTFGAPWLNRKNVARLTSRQADKTGVDAAGVITDTALKLIGEAQKQADRAHREAQEAKAETVAVARRVEALEHHNGAVLAHVAALTAQIVRGDPPPPVAPPIPY